MKKLFMLVIIVLFSISSLAIAGDVHVDGYYRDDGTYVQPHVRSSPDGSKANNYGPSHNDRQQMNPSSRDYDNDGWSNNMDRDSDSDGTWDNRDDSPYNSEDDGFDW